mmetsp:Transcript_32340/g.50578  ORF Transcript_32340/g.50578 Transcript_32340/m.50578 type:complete len:146 (-) Transcript_32340:45-482(-)
MNTQRFIRTLPAGACQHTKVGFTFPKRTVVSTFTSSMGDPIELSKNCVAVVKFTAKWCGPCKTIAPQFSTLSDHYPSVNFYDLDVDENSTASKKYTVRAIPTFLILHNEKIEARIEGSAIASVKEAIDKLVSAKIDDLKDQRKGE